MISKNDLLNYEEWKKHGGDWEYNPSDEVLESVKIIQDIKFLKIHYRDCSLVGAIGMSIFMIVALILLWFVGSGMYFIKLCITLIGLYVTYREEMEEVIGYCIMQEIKDTEELYDINFDEM